jgi:tyrosyl-tRNA synthetase
MRIITSGNATVVPKAALREKLASGRSLKVKLGVDPTAPDLHLGHAVPLRKLRQLQDIGHRVILIIGDATALIGDPSGRNSTRPPLSPDEIAANAQTYVDQAYKLLDESKTELRYNSEWLSPLTLEQILKLTAQFTVARILERDDFSQRYQSERPISLHEFLYPVMQAYDSVVVAADIEIGGNDQLFNLLAGRELMEKQGMSPQVCLTLPLLEGTDGHLKMSKSYGNYIGITDEPADMFGKLMSIPDSLMERYFHLASTLTPDEIDVIVAGLTSGSLHPNACKRRLAANIVSLYWGEDAARTAEAAFDRVFKDHNLPANIPEISADFDVDHDGLVYMPPLLVAVGLAASNGEARRLVDNGGVKVNGQALAKGAYKLEAQLLKGAVISAGKRKFVKLI